MKMKSVQASNASLHLPLQFNPSPEALDTTAFQAQYSGRPWRCNRRASRGFSVLLTGRAAATIGQLSNKFDGHLFGLSG
jgi:hypothetical protein